MDLLTGFAIFILGFIIGALVTTEIYSDKINFKYKIEHHEIKCDTLRNGNLHCYELLKNQ